MSGDNGVNLLGTLDVDENRARFVASSGLFGTAYQFVMPREQIQVLRVPTASTPYNALELHTKYRRNILCDFDDNLSVFRRCVKVMNLHQLPQGPSSPSSRGRQRGGRQVAPRRRRDAASTRSASVARRSTPRRRATHRAVRHPPLREGPTPAPHARARGENEHLHGEVEVLYAQVDEQSERIDDTFREFERAAEEAVRAFIGTGRRDDETRAAERAVEREAAARASGRPPPPSPPSPRRRNGKRRTKRRDEKRPTRTRTQTQTQTRMRVRGCPSRPRRTVRRRRFACGSRPGAARNALRRTPTVPRGNPPARGRRGRPGSSPTRRRRRPSRRAARS